MRPPEPFFYPQQLHRFAAGHGRRQLLWGGRGIGKSTWLLEAHARLTKTQLLRPAHFFQAAIDLAPETQLVLIDGLDLIARHAESRERLLELIGAPLLRDDLRVIAASRMDRGQISRMLGGVDDYDLFSDWVSHFSAERLNPWAWNWEGRVREALIRVDWITDVMASELLSLSGGHPALLGAGVDALRLRIHQPGDSGEGPLDERAVPGGAAALTEPMMESARNLAGKLLAELQAEPSGSHMLDKTRRAALAVLTDVVRGAGEPDDASVLARNYLLTSGLIYESPEGALTVPGPLLHEVFAALLVPAPSPAPSPTPTPVRRPAGSTQLRVRVEPDGGHLTWRRSDTDHRECALEGKSWAIIEQLARRRADERTREDWLSPGEIAQGANTTDAYVRVVVRRLRTQLAASRIELIATDRSQGGYRFVVPVVFDD